MVRGWIAEKQLCSNKLGRRLPISVLSRIERGKYNENVSVSMLLDIAEGLGIDVALFVTFDEHEKAMWECEIDNSQPCGKYMGV